MAKKTAEAPEAPVTNKKNDAYTGFLAISFLAMVGATVLLYLEYQNYEGKTPPKAPPIEVPGIQVKTIPGSGNPQKPPPPPAPMEEPMPMPKDPKPLMRLSPSLPETGNAILQVQAVDSAPVNVVEIPELSAPAAVKAPAVLPPIISSIDPNLDDAPPISTKRFAPPQ